MEKINMLSSSDQLLNGYIPGSLPEEVVAQKSILDIKTKFDIAKKHYDHLVSKRKFFTDQINEASEEANGINERIRKVLCSDSESARKDVIDLRAAMNERLIMVENYRFLEEECKSSIQDSEDSLGKIVRSYTDAYAFAMNLIADNMMGAAVGGMSGLCLAMRTKEMAMQLDKSTSPIWAQLGFDSTEAAVHADVAKRIALVYRSIDDTSIWQHLPQALSAAIETGGIKPFSPAASHVASFKRNASVSMEQAI